MAAKKHWIAFTKKTSGKLFLDDGAVNAIRHQGKSLLPSGVRQVEGKFGRGDMVSLCDLQGKEIARGVTEYAQGEILQIMGQKSSRIREILGYKYHEEIIHRDNLVIKSSTPNQDGESNE